MLKQIGVVGAGFSEGSDLSCVFTNSDGSEFDGVVVQRVSNQYLICEAELAEGMFLIWKDIELNDIS